MYTPKIIAHRGSSGCYPENTMPAFTAAVADGADAIETDVRLTADNKLILMHDSSLKRMFGKDMNVREYYFEDLKRYSVSCKYGPQYGNVYPAELCELLEFIKLTSLKLNIELKSDNTDFGLLERMTVDEVWKYDLTERVIFSSFDHVLLKRIKKYSPQSHTAILYSNPIADVEKYACDLGCDAIHPNVACAVYDDTVPKALEKGLKVNVWTVDDPRDAKELKNLGATGLITNFPKEIRERL